jgi:hypothetical protein
MSKPAHTAARLVVALSAVFTMIGASAQQGVRAHAEGNDAQARYQQQRAACMSGQSNQDRATCLKEAGAALAEAKRGNLTSDGRGQLRQNETDRCQALTGAERTDCIARMRGEGKTEGSVAGGGILREKVTIEPAPASGSTTTPATPPTTTTAPAPAK